MPGDDSLVFIEKSPNEEQWKNISDALERSIHHSVWTNEFDADENMKAVYDAMQKKQNIAVAMNNAGLSPGYCIGI